MAGHLHRPGLVIADIKTLETNLSGEIVVQEVLPRPDCVKRGLQERSQIHPAPQARCRSVARSGCTSSGTAEREWISRKQWSRIQRAGGKKRGGSAGRGRVGRREENKAVF